VAALEQESEHVIARVLVAAAHERQLVLPPMREFRALPGLGAQAVVGGNLLKVGGPRLLEHENIELPAEFAPQVEHWEQSGQSVIYLLQDQIILAAFALADVIRPESYEAVRLLKEQGLRVAMLTGDSQAVANWVAEELGLDEVFAEVLPEQKHQKIQELRQYGKVAMVGDGVNDAPALAQADVGIAIGAGTDVARASAGIVLVRDDPREVIDIITLSKASYRKMVQNLGWAAGYNVIALPLAAGVLAPWGFVLPPAISALLMSLSTIIVALNAQALRHLQLKQAT
jgi:Cu2+-exporting ATPase